MQVTLANVSKKFGSRTVLSEMSAEFLGPGSYSLMGPSGSGKSTILSLIAGMDEPDLGAITFVTKGVLTVRPRIAWILQSSPLLTRRSIWDNVALGPLVRGAKIEEIQERISELLSRFGIASLAHTKVAQLSGGERQRVAVIRALASGDRIILADEPTASLDPQMRDIVCDALLSASEAGALVLIATHDQTVADRCTHTVKLHRESVHDAPE